MKHTDSCNHLFNSKLASFCESPTNCGWLITSAGDFITSPSSLKRLCDELLENVVGTFDSKGTTKHDFLSNKLSAFNCVKHTRYTLYNFSDIREQEERSVRVIITNLSYSVIKMRLGEEV